MILWKTEKLVEQICDNQLSEIEKKNYLIAGSLISLFCLQLGYSTMSSTLLKAGIEFLAYSLIYFVGFQMAFKKFKTSAKITFIEAYVILSVPLLIKMILLGLVVGSAWGVLLEVFKWPEDPFVPPLLGYLVTIWFFWRLITHFRNLGIESDNDA